MYLRHLLIPAITAVLLLGGCTTAGEQPDTVTITQTRSPQPGPSPEPELPAPTGPPSATAETGDDAGTGCSTDVHHSDLGPALERGIVPAGELGAQPWEVTPLPDMHYHFSIRESAYDSCRPLSHVVLQGMHGDAARPAGISAALADVVVFFRHGETITNPAPFLMRSVESATPISDTEVEVRYGHAGRSTPEGVTEHHTLRFFHDHGLSAAGSLPESIDDHLRLDLAGVLAPLP